MITDICTVHNQRHIVQIWLHFYMILELFKDLIIPRTISENMIQFWLDFSLIREDPWHKGKPTERKSLPATPKPHLGTEILKCNPLCTLPPPTGGLKWCIKEEEHYSQNISGNTNLAKKKYLLVNFVSHFSDHLVIQNLSEASILYLNSLALQRMGREILSFRPWIFAYYCLTRRYNSGVIQHHPPKHLNSRQLWFQISTL